MRRKQRTDHGSVTAEFAVVAPAVMLVLACCLGAIQAVGQQVRVADAAAQGSRALARGEGAESAGNVARHVARAMPVAVSIDNRGEFSCMTVRAEAVFPPARLIGVTVTATACALRGGL